MKKVFKRSLSVLLALVLFCGVVPFGALTASAANASTQSTITTGSIITYGSYPQTKVTDAGLIAELNAQTLSDDNTVTYSGSKYLKQTDWFKFEPIQWRVLSNTNGELFVMAEKILESRAYNQEYTGVTWENCTLRAWLNNDFYNAAFTSAEQAKIETSTVVNEDNPYYGTDGGNNTSDKLFLLSYAEATNAPYGFSSGTGSDTARAAQGTDFAKSQGLYVNGENSYWWLRSPGYLPYYAGIVYIDGSFINTVYIPHIGARPAFKLNLTSDIFTSKTGSSCVIDYLDGVVYGLTPGITTLADDVDVEAGYELVYVPTANGFGTGTVVNVTLDGVTVESYTIIIYGDVNGDGSTDSLDAGMMVDVENYLVTWDPAIDFAFIEAGDLNGDGTIDSIDAGIAVDAENYMVTIDQSTGLVAGG